jgi:probable rRNA maturation factor
LLTFSGQQGKDLSILFVDNKKIARFNKQFFGKNRPTNVISFSYMEETTPLRGQAQAHRNLYSEHREREGEAGYPLAGAALPVEGATPLRGQAQAPVIEEIIGDIIISLEKAKEEAEALSCPFYERVFALIIHGLLHVSGYDHINDRNEARRMRYRERKFLDYVCSHQLYKELTG